MVIISEKNWNSIQETLYLYSIFRYVESLEKAYEETDWENAKTYDPKDWQE